MADTATIEGVADALFGAIERGDRRDNDRGRALRVIYWFIGITTGRRYEILDRRFFDGGFVQQHVHARHRSRGLVDLDACLHRDQGGRRRSDQPHRRIFRPRSYGTVAGLSRKGL
jgi:hypothetical protein